MVTLSNCDRRLFRKLIKMMANRSEVQSNEKRNGVASPLERIEPIKSLTSQLFFTVVEIE